MFLLWNALTELRSPLGYSMCAAVAREASQGGGDGVGELLVNARVAVPKRVYASKQVRLACRLGFGNASVSQKRFELVCPGAPPMLALSYVLVLLSTSLMYSYVQYSTLDCASGGITG